MLKPFPTSQDRNLLRRGLVALLALAICAAIAGCSTGGSSPGGSTNDDTLRFASYGPPIRSWDPQVDGRPASNLLLFAVYDRLIGYTPDGGLQPQLATSWEFKDPKTFTLTLRKGVQFQDGTKFDAQAVKANIEREKTVQDGTGPWAGPLQVVKSVQVDDPTHVTLHLAEPAGYLPQLFANAAGAMISPAAFKSNLNEKPVGAGMYRLEKWTPDGSATLKAFDGYWDKKAVGPTTIEVPFQIDQLRRLDMFKAGEVDATFGHTSFVAGAIKAGIDVDPVTSPNFWFMDFNMAKKPFDDKRVRLAINYAMDRDALIKAVLGGQAEANEQPFDVGSVGFNTGIGETPYPYDPDKAKQLLNEAGYGDGLSFQCDIVGSSGGAYAQYLEVIKNQLAKVGITLNIKLVESQSAALLVDHTTNCALMPYGLPSNILTAKELFGADGYYNAANEASPEMTKLLNAVDAAQTEKEQKSAFEALTKKVVADGLFTGVFYEKWAVISNDKVKGLKFWKTGGYTEFRNISMK